jgi:hypothetical protein
VALVLVGCSAGDFRAIHFGDYRPAPPSKKIDAAVAIETNFLTQGLYIRPDLATATRQVTTEDLATLFTKPSFARGAGEEFVVRADIVVLRGDGLEITVTVLDARAGTTLAARKRSAAHTGLLFSMGRLYGSVMPALKEDLRRAFDELAQGPRRPEPVAARARPAAPPRAESTPTRPYGASWALVVGINAYRHADPLNYAVNDARAVAAMLPRLGFDTVRVLLDAEATKAAIERVIYGEFQDRMGPTDRLFVFFAGHGITVPLPRGGEEGYLIPVDGDPRRPALTAIPMDEVRKMGRRVSAKHIFFAIDACFSGFAVTRDIGAEAVRDPDLVAVLQEPVVQVLTAGRKGQKAIEEEGHGLFTRRLLDGLRGLADRDRRGFVTVTQLAAWMAPRVTRDSEGRQHPQYSALDGEGDFVFVLPGQ